MSLGFGLAGSRRTPRGTMKVIASAPAELKKDSSDVGVRRMAEDAAARPNAKRPRVFFDVAIGGEASGRIVCELYSDIVPRTAENFRLLCTGDRGIGLRGKPLHYKGCSFHRIVPNLLVQTGDFTKCDGTGGESIYGMTFEDENFDLGHSSAGILSMATKGPDSNNSQFFILTRASPDLDGKNVVFGRVVEGMEVVRRVETCGTSGVGGVGGTVAMGVSAVGPSAWDAALSFKPTMQAFIRNCGEFAVGTCCSGLAALQDASEPAAKRSRHADGEVSREVHAFHILKRHTSCSRLETWQGKQATCSRARARHVMETLRKRIVSATSMRQTFVELARDHSDDARAPHGGDLGMVEREELAPEVEDVAFALPCGGLSDVFETEAGIHLMLRAA